MIFSVQSNTIVDRILYLLAKSRSRSTHLRQIQAQIILCNLLSDTTIISNFIKACESLNSLDSALVLFNHFPRKPHVFICNSLIRAFCHSTYPRNSIDIYTYMIKNSIKPNDYTYTFTLKSLSDLKNFTYGQSVHAQIVKTNHINDIYVGNSLLDMYYSCGDIFSGQKLFEEMPQRDVVSWTVLISGCRNVGHLEEALTAFERMQFSGILPNPATMVNVLSACSEIGALDMGVWIHNYIRKNGWKLDVILGTSLIDMYGKCGKVDIARKVFEEMPDRNTFTWNSLINCLALAKCGETALFFFSRMEKEGIIPDQVSLIGVLCACNRCGLVETGRQIFSWISSGKYGFSPGIKHYGCMIDLLGRSGFFNEALELVERMPFKPNCVIWCTLLSGSRARGNLELSELAAKRLVELNPDNAAYYVALSNLYAEMERWDDVVKVRRFMKKMRLMKDYGFSTLGLHLEESTKDDDTKLLTCLQCEDI